MLGENGPVGGVLLGHIALAVILAVFTRQLIRPRLLCASLGTLAALVTMVALSPHVYPIEKVGTVLRFGLGGAEFHWMEEAEFDTQAAVEYFLIVVFLAPFVFAYYAACIWEPCGDQAKTGWFRIRLRGAMLVVWTICSVLAINRWIVTKSIPIFPISLFAALLLLRPIHRIRLMRLNAKNRRRHSRIKRRLSRVRL